jgi:hypothetical protein
MSDRTAPSPFELAPPRAVTTHDGLISGMSDRETFEWIEDHGLASRRYFT